MISRFGLGDQPSPGIFAVSITGPEVREQPLLPSSPQTGSSRQDFILLPFQ